MFRASRSPPWPGWPACRTVSWKLRLQDFDQFVTKCSHFSAERAADFGLPLDGVHGAEPIAAVPPAGRRGGQQSAGDAWRQPDWAAGERDRADQLGPHRAEGSVQPAAGPATGQPKQAATAAGGSAVAAGDPRLPGGCVQQAVVVVGDGSAAAAAENKWVDVWILYLSGFL